MGANPCGGLSLVSQSWPGLWGRPPPSLYLFMAIPVHSIGLRARLPVALVYGADGREWGRTRNIWEGPRRHWECLTSGAVFPETFFQIRASKVVRPSCPRAGRTAFPPPLTSPIPSPQPPPGCVRVFPTASRVWGLPSRGRARPRWEAIRRRIHVRHPGLRIKASPRRQFSRPGRFFPGPTTTTLQKACHSVAGQTLGIPFPQPRAILLRERYP